VPPRGGRAGRAHRAAARSRRAGRCWCGLVAGGNGLTAQSQQLRGVGDRGERAVQCGGDVDEAAAMKSTHSARTSTGASPSASTHQPERPGNCASTAATPRHVTAELSLPMIKAAPLRSAAARSAPRSGLRPRSRGRARHIGEAGCSGGSFSASHRPASARTRRGRSASPAAMACGHPRPNLAESRRFWQLSGMRPGPGSVKVTVTLGGQSTAKPSELAMGHDRRSPLLFTTGPFTGLSPDLYCT
jgi:hypothetical protein